MNENTGKFFELVVLFVKYRWGKRNSFKRFLIDVA